MDASGSLIQRGKGVEGREFDFVGVVGTMCIPVFDLFAGLRRELKTDRIGRDRAIVRGFRRRGACLTKP
jgi:hypothetical protein